MATPRPSISAVRDQPLAVIVTGPGTSADRLKIQKIAGNANAASRSDSAMDLESEEMLEQFKCPICEEVPLEEIYQCSNGHTICNRCQEKSKKDTCAQCNGLMKTCDGNWIRSRPLEQILDSLWYTCAFRKNGCLAKLARRDIRKHIQLCTFGEESIQICRHFLEGDDCQFKMNCTKPQEAVKHFKEKHKGSFLSRGGVRIYPRIQPDKLRYPIFLAKDDRFYMFVTNVDRKDDSINFLGIGIHKSLEDERGAEAEIEIKSQSSKVSDLKITMAMVPFQDAPSVLDRRPLFRLSKSFLEEHYLDKETGKLNFDIKIL